MRIIGYLNIGSNLIWKKSVLGKIYKAKIGNKMYQIHFLRPSSKITDYNCDISLVVPNIVCEMGLKDNYIEFGDIIEYGDFNSIINYVIITGEVSSDNEIEEIYSKIDKWVYSFLSILKLSGNIIRQENKVKYKSNYLELFIEKNNKYKRPVNMNMPILTINWNSQAISDSKVKQTIEILNKGTEIPKEYEYYLKALKYFEKGIYRNCVLECATEAEMAVSNRIIFNFEKNKIKNYCNIINNDHDGLESKYKKLIYFNDRQKLDITKISKPRNKAIHAGTEISKEEARESLNITKKLLDNFNKFY